MNKHQVDTLRVKYVDKDSIPKKHNNTNNTIVIIEPKSEKTYFYENPIFTLIIVPVLVLIISGLFTKYVNRKKEGKESKKLDIETSKIKEEIKNLKSSFQPIVLSTIQKTQDFLLKEKIEILKSLVVFNSRLFKIQQQYIEGEAFYNDISDYHNSIYLNIDDQIFDYFKSNISDKRYFFKQIIIDDVFEIIKILDDVLEDKKRRESIERNNIFEAPEGFEKKMENIASRTDLLMEKIRTDLHLNSNFIHDFINQNKNS